MMAALRLKTLNKRFCWIFGPAASFFLFPIFAISLGFTSIQRGVMRWKTMLKGKCRNAFD